MKCLVCKRKFKQDDKVISVFRYVENERHGDFVTSQPSAWIHVRHLTEER
jgi:hypothetical protein